jgi:hypothetical protein
VPDPVVVKKKKKRRSCCHNCPDEPCTGKINWEHEIVKYRKCAIDENGIEETIFYVPLMLIDFSIIQCAEIDHFFIA